MSTLCKAQHGEHKTGSATPTQNGRRRHLCKTTNLNNSAIYRPIRTKLETSVHFVQLSMTNTKPEVQQSADQTWITLLPHFVLFTVMCCLVLSLILVNDFHYPKTANIN